MQAKNRTRLAFCAAFLVFVGGMVCATLWDLPLSRAIADPACAWAIVLEIVGELPAMVFSACNLGILALAAYRTRTRSAHVWQAVGFCALMLALSTYTTHTTLSYFEQYLSMPFADGIGGWAVAVLCGAALTAIELYLLSRLTSDCILRAKPIAVACIHAALIVLVSVVFLKQLWGRVRYRQMLAAGDFSLFSPWYLIQGFGNTSHVSFPSGHTANAAVFVLFSCYFPRKRKWLIPALLAWVALCATSRIFIGAHFLSDVLFGAALSLAICYLLRPRTNML